MLWVEEQRAIAELMIVRDDGDATTCLGFAAFVEQFDVKFERWFKDFASRLSDVDLSRRRLTELFNLLLILGDALDPEGLRYERREWQEPDAQGKIVGKLE